MLKVSAVRVVDDASCQWSISGLTEAELAVKNFSYTILHTIAKCWFANEYFHRIFKQRSTFKNDRSRVSSGAV